MKNHRFLWLRNRTTDNRKCEKSRNIKEKRTIEMFSTVSKQLVELHSSPNVNHTFSERTISKDFRTPQDFGFGEFFGIFLKNYFENQKIIVKIFEILL